MSKGILAFLGITFAGIPAVIFVLSLYYLPLAMATTLIGLRSIERRFEESGLLFWNRRQIFWRLIIPVMKPYLFLGWIFVFVLALNEYGAALLLQAQLFITDLFLQFSELFKPQIAVVESCILLGVILVIVIGAMRYFSRRRYVTLKAAVQGIEQIPCKGMACTSYAYLAIVTILCTMIPLITLIKGMESWDVFWMTLRSADEQLLNSLVFSAMTVLVACVLGFLIANYLHSSRSMFKHAMDAVTYFIFAAPSMIIGVGLILFWNRRGLAEMIYTSGAIVIIGLLVKYLPLMIKAITASMARHHPAFEEAARVGGLSMLQRWLRVTIPMNAAAIMIGAGLLFVFTMNELNIIMLLVPPGKATLSIRLFTLMHFAPDSVLFSLGIGIVVINMLACAVMLGVYKISRFQPR